MESVEDLVIGKEAGMLLMVHESLVDGFLYRGKPDLIPFQLLTVEDILQSFLLLLAVCQYIQGIALELIILKSLGEKIEILVEQRLRCHIKSDESLVIALGCQQMLLLSGNITLRLLAEFNTHVLNQRMLKI